MAACKLVSRDTADISDSGSKNYRLTNYPDAVTISIGECRPTRAVAVMVTSGKENSTNTDSGAGYVTERMVQVNKTLPRFGCITCKAQTVVWPESGCLECKSKPVYSPGDLVMIHDTIMSPGLNGSVGAVIAELDGHGAKRYSTQVIGPSPAHGSA